MDQMTERAMDLEITATRGTIAGASKWSETRVSSTGGGGHVHNGTGYVNAPTVSSFTTTNQEFSLVTDDGREIAVQLRNSDVPPRNGQTVTMIYASRPSLATMYATALVNHNLDRHWSLRTTAEACSALQLGTMTDRTIVHGTGFLGVTAGLLLIFYPRPALAMDSALWTISLCAAGIYVLRGAWLYARRRKFARTAFERRIDEAVRMAFRVSASSGPST